jgi:hypothetical protein
MEYEKYAWVLLFAPAIIALIIGAMDLFRPLEPSYIPTPSEAFHIRAYGAAGTGVGIFGLAIILKSFRRGEKWSWYALWYYPIFYLVLYGYLQATSFAGLGPGSVLLPVFAAISLVGLVLPYGKFFPKRGV